MRLLKRCLMLGAAGLLALEAQVVAGEEEATRPEQRFELFQVSSAPAVVPQSAAAKLAENRFEREFIYSRWVRLNDIDFASAKAGDRVLVSVSEGEAFELELTLVDSPSDRTTLWYGRFPNMPGSTLFVVFSRPRGIERKPSFTLAGLSIPLQGRQIEVNTAEDLPGWALLREIKPGTGTHLDNSDDAGSPEWRASALKEAERLRREQERQDTAPPETKKR